MPQSGTRTKQNGKCGKGNQPSNRMNVEHRDEAVPQLALKYNEIPNY